MVERVIIDKAVNGYVLTTSWLNSPNNTIIFKDMPQLIRHLDDCFSKPLKDLTYVTKLVKEYND